MASIKEIMPIDADTLNGSDSSTFEQATHNHDSAYYNTNTITAGEYAVFDSDGNITSEAAGLSLQSFSKLEYTGSTVVWSPSSSRIKAANIICIGGGGGGGAAIATRYVDVYGQCGSAVTGAGRSGSVSRSLYTNLPSTLYMYVGAGGLGGTTATGENSYGKTGEDTWVNIINSSIDPIIMAIGGSGTTVCSNTYITNRVRRVTYNGTYWGTASNVGDLIMNGTCGHEGHANGLFFEQLYWGGSSYLPALASTITPSIGGSTPGGFGSGGFSSGTFYKSYSAASAGSTANATINGKGYGSGGGGGWSFSSRTDTTGVTGVGGNGANGAILIWEYA